jgi:hypothetical protein
VEIQLNNTRLNATTPVAQDMRYDAFCAPGEGHCTIIGSAFMNIADPNKARVTFCLKDGGKRQCDSSNAFVTITLEFEPD